MKRPTRLPGVRRHLLLAVVLLAAGSVPAAAAHTPVPLGVTETAPATSRNDRVGVLSRDGVHFCTASVVHSERRDLIVTAAHCLGDGGDLVFAPGYRDGRAPYGEWAVTRTYVSAGWEGRKDEDSDVAFARVAPRSDKEDKRIEDVVGANTLGRGHRATGRAVTLVGYPKSRETPVSCTNLTAAYGDSQQRVACPGFSGGTSGSPWLDGRGHVVGVLGGHLEGGDTDDVSYSVVLGDEAAELYWTAGG